MVARALVPAALLSLASAASAQFLHEEDVLQQTPPDGFGASLSTSAGRALVGAAGDDAGEGAAHVYVLTPAGWVPEAKLEASDAQPGDELGHGVALDGDRALVGAPFDDDLGSSSGAAYVFERTPGGWVETAKLLSADGAADDRFGTQVAIHGDRALVSAPRDDDQGELSGSVYVFELGPSGWTQTAKLLASDGGPESFFGDALDVEGDVALVGAPWKDGAVGAAYVIELGAGGWTETAKLALPGGALRDFFGWQVALSGERALVTAYRRGSANHPDAGAGYVFVRTPGGWTQEAPLLHPLAQGDVWLGFAAALEGDRAVLTYSSASGPPSAAHLYEREGAAWKHRAAFHALQGAALSEYDAAAVAGEHVLLGTVLNEEVYVFDMPQSGCAFRAGTLGLNPADFACAGEPVLGTPWLSTIATAPLLGTTTLATYVATGFGGATSGIPALGFELLVLPPLGPLHASATAEHAIPVPFDPVLLDFALPTQGARIELGTGGQIHVVLTNAQDVVLGL